MIENQQENQIRRYIHAPTATTAMKSPGKSSATRTHTPLYVHQTPGESKQATRPRRNPMGKRRRQGQTTETTRYWSRNLAEEDEEEIRIAVHNEESAGIASHLSVL